jgi:hypothetical protein
MPVAPASAQDGDNSRAVKILESEPPQPAKKGSADLGSSQTMVDPSFKMENSAGLTVDVLPDTEFPVGTNVTFRVSSQKPGYLVLVDVDAAGTLKQIYPNPNSLLAPGATSETANRINRGQTVRVPDAANPYAGFAFVAAPPTGIAMVIAVLSDRPVQVLDLPDIPPQMLGRAEALKFLTDFARSLRIARNDDSGRFEEPKFSFAAKFYVVR